MQIGGAAICNAAKLRLEHVAFRWNRLDDDDMLQLIDVERFLVDHMWSIGALEHGLRGSRAEFPVFKEGIAPRVRPAGAQAGPPFATGARSIL
ncbi:hypothetical protein CR492_01530 [Methylocella silvestris]|uniref:Uncharacterized protein n=1 Tax=Methylocella silvestris TaxID=199596 RepID=A0A2J7TLH0_METSI|nr:hypothetical protein CR492_01530 [Methylocella silvestris]